MTTAADVLTRLDHAECDAAFTCKASFPAGQGVTFEEVFGTSATACYAKLASEYYDAPAVQASITANKITFDAAAGAQCITALASAPAPSCPSLWQNGPSFPAACDGALIGRVADGASCTNDFECAGGSYCDVTCKAIP